MTFWLKLDGHIKVRVCAVVIRFEDQPLDHGSFYGVRPQIRSPIQTANIVAFQQSLYNGYDIGVVSNYKEIINILQSTRLLAQ